MTVRLLLPSSDKFKGCRFHVLGYFSKLWPAKYEEKVFLFDDAKQLKFTVYGLPINYQVFEKSILPNIGVPLVN